MGGLFRPFSYESNGHGDCYPEEEHQYWHKSREHLSRGGDVCKMLLRSSDQNRSIPECEAGSCRRDDEPLPALRYLTSSHDHDDSDEAEASCDCPRSWLETKVAPGEKTACHACRSKQDPYGPSEFNHGIKTCNAVHVGSSCLLSFAAEARSDERTIQRRHRVDHAGDKRIFYRRPRGIGIMIWNPRAHE